MNKINREEAQAKAANLGLPAGPLSFTQIETFLKCQRQYYIKYIVKPPLGFSLVMAMGSAMHKGLEVLHKGLIADTNPRTLQTISRHLDSALSELRSSIALIVDNPAVDPAGVPTIQKQGQCLEELLKLWTREYVPELNIVGAEESFYVVIDNVPTTIRIDLNRGTRLSDFKLSGKDKTQKDVDNSLQLAVYALGADITETSFIALRYPKPEKLARWEPSICEVVADKNPRDKEWAKEIIRSVCKSLTSKPDNLPEYFPPCNTSDWLCSPDYCDAWPLCRGKSKPKMPGWLSNVGK